MTIPAYTINLLGRHWVFGSIKLHLAVFVAIIHFYMALFVYIHINLGLGHFTITNVRLDGTLKFSLGRCLKMLLDSPISIFVCKVKLSKS